MEIVLIKNLEDNIIIGYGVYDSSKEKILKVCENEEEAAYYLEELNEQKPLN